MIFTNLGNVIYRPIHELTDTRWKDLGEHLSQSLNNFKADEEIIDVEVIEEFKDQNFLVVTKRGQIKQIELTSFSPWRTYRTKSMPYVKLKMDDDEVIFIKPVSFNEVMLISENGYALRLNLDEIALASPKSAGFKAMTLKEGDKLKSAFFTNSNSWYLLTQRGFIKRVKTEAVPLADRASRGTLVLRPLKNNNHTVFAAGRVYQTRTDLSAASEEVNLLSDILNIDQEKITQILSVISDKNKTIELDLMSLNLSDKTSNGHPIDDEIDRVLSCSTTD